MGMMQGIRDHAKGWLAWIVFILICIPFALFGIQQYFYGSAGDVVVASVNGADISVQQFQLVYQRQRQRLQALLGSRFDINKIDEKKLKQETLDDLVNQQLVIQAAGQDGLRISDALLASQIRQLSAFRSNGAFSKEQYEQVLRSQGYAPAAFENDFRRSVLVAQVRAGVGASAIATTAEVDNMLRMEFQKRRFSLLTVPAARFADAKLSDEQIGKYYDEHKSSFVVPEQVNAAYLELSREKVEQSIQPTEDELRSSYEAHKANYTVPEQRRVSHILIKLPKKASDEEVAKARAKLEKIRKEIENGASFADMAKKYSQDPGSADKGGDLGLFSKDTIEQGLKDAVFSMKQGQVSEPVRTSFGLHLVKVTAIQAAKVKTFEQAKAQVLRDYRKEKSENLYYGQSERLANLTFEQPDSLESAAKALHLQIQHTGFFPRSGRQDDTLASNPKVVQAAFSPDVLEQGNNSQPIELSGDRVVVLRVAEHKPEVQRSLKQARDDIVAALRARIAKSRAEELGRKLLERLQKGEDPAKLAASEQLSWEQSADVTRDERSMSPEVVDTAFSMPRPAPGKSTYDGVELASGDFAVIALRKVTDGDPAKVPAAQKQALRARLQREYGERDYSDYVRMLRKQAKVEIHSQNL